MNIKEKISNAYSGAKEKAKTFGRKIKKGVRTVLIVGGLFAIILCVANAKINELEAKLRAALQETEHIEVTNIVLEEKLIPVQELATSRFEYTGLKEIDKAREVLGVNIPLTTKEIDISYSGVIEVGYDLNDMNYEIIPGLNTIVLQLPKPTVDSYIIQDTIVCKEKNNILNPIHADEVSKCLVDVEKDELQRAEQQGIYTEAEEHLKHIISTSLAELNYKIFFI